MKNTLKVILIVLISFGVYFILDDLFFKDFRNWINTFIGQLGISHIIAYIISGIPLLIGTYFVVQNKFLLKSLGLYGSLTKGFVFAVLCTLPMYIGFSFIYNFSPDITINKFLISVVSAGLFEEIYFRGFLFGLLYKYTKLGFVPSVFLGSFFFGLIHLYQSTDISQLIGIFSITFIGGIIFAWVYAEWKFNLWTPIFLHMLMNLSWEVFEVSENALGGIYANIFRLLTIILVIGIIFLYKKKRKISIEINKHTVWISSQNVVEKHL